jgi:hypothetical protein
VRRRWTGVAWSMVVVFLVGYGVGVPLSVANGSFEQDSGLLLAFAAFMAVARSSSPTGPAMPWAGSSRRLAC